MFQMQFLHKLAEILVLHTGNTLIITITSCEQIREGFELGPLPQSSSG